MIIAEVLSILLLILGMMLVFLAYWLAAVALFPRMVGRARDRYKRPVWTTLVGLAVVAPAFVIGILLLASSNNPLVRIPGLLIGITPLMLGMLGSAGLCQLGGGGLSSPKDSSQPWHRVLRGGVVLDFCFLLPLVGWFVVMPWALISGCGAIVLSFSKSQPSRAGTTRGRTRPDKTTRSPGSKEKPSPQPTESRDTPRSVSRPGRARGGRA